MDFVKNYLPRDMIIKYIFFLKNQMRIHCLKHKKDVYYENIDNTFIWKEEKKFCSIRLEYDRLSPRLIKKTFFSFEFYFACLIVLETRSMSFPFIRSQTAACISTCYQIKWHQYDYGLYRHTLIGFFYSFEPRGTSLI